MSNVAFAFVGPDGLPTGGGIRRELPPGAIPLRPPLTTADLPRLRWTGAEWAWRAVEPDPAPTPEEIAARAAARLAQARAGAVARVNAQVDAVRARIYTNITGQDALYLEKRAEAVAYVRQAEMSGEPADLSDYPLLAGEVGVTAPTAWQLAQVWLHRSDQFKALGAATEAARMRAAVAIAAATDDDALDRIVSRLTTDFATLSQTGA